MTLFLDKTKTGALNTCKFERIQVNIPSYVHYIFSMNIKTLIWHKI
jgi:hypothetical protein